MKEAKYQILAASKGEIDKENNLEESKENPKPPENSAELIQQSVPIGIAPIEPQWQQDDLPA